MSTSSDRPSAGWPWVAKGAGTAGGPGAGAGRRIRRDLIVLVASLAVFAGCAVIVADGRVGPAEQAVFHAINGLPGWLYRPTLVAQYLGVLGMPLVLVVPLKLVLEQVAKQLVQRQRPGTTVPDAILRGVPHGGLSFTSGHAIITFAIAGLLVLVLPPLVGVAAFVLAACNGLARVYVGGAQPAGCGRRSGDRPDDRRRAGPDPGRRPSPGARPARAERPGARGSGHLRSR